MIRFVLIPLIALLPLVAVAQVNDDQPENGTITLTPELDLEDTGLDDIQEVEQEQAAVADGAILRGLDKVSGTLTDLEMATGQTQRMGRIDVTLGECRFPKGNPSGDAYAFLVIRAEGVAKPVFEGWMIASSPALNALDHPRYDVWVIRCATS